GDPGRQQAGAHVVDAVLTALPGQVEDQAGRDQGGDADGNVDVEDPAPGGVVDEEAAEQRPGHRGQSKDGAEVPHVAAALAGGDDVARDLPGAYEKSPCADALEGPEPDQLDHVLGEPAEHGSDQEDDDRALKDALAPVEVADLSVQRRGDRRGEDVGGHHPGELGEAAQVAHDGGQGGGDDGLV